MGQVGGDFVIPAGPVELWQNGLRHSIRRLRYAYLHPRNAFGSAGKGSVDADQNLRCWRRFRLYQKNQWIYRETDGTARFRALNMANPHLERRCKGQGRALCVEICKVAEFEMFLGIEK